MRPYVSDIVYGYDKEHINPIVIVAAESADFGAYSEP